MRGEEIHASRVDWKGDAGSKDGIISLLPAYGWCAVPAIPYEMILSTILLKYPDS